MIVTTLIENTKQVGRDDLKAEHGLSLFVEWQDHTLLFDTGASGAFLPNARFLGVDVCRAEWVVISHHHYDHGGGLPALMASCSRATVYLHAARAWGRWFRAFRVLKRPIGLDRSVVERYSDRFRFLESDTEIAPGVFVLTSIARRYPVPRGNRFLHVEEGGRLHHDPFDHEIVLVIRDGEGLVVFTGCSHNGIRNMVDQVVRAFPGERIRAVLGGFHLVGLPVLNTMAESRSEVVSLGKALLNYPVDRYYSGHCTGPRAFEVLKDVMGDRLRTMATGSRLEV